MSSKWDHVHRICSTECEFEMILEKITLINYEGQIELKVAWYLADSWRSDIIVLTELLATIVIFLTAKIKRHVNISHLSH